MRNTPNTTSQIVIVILYRTVAEYGASVHPSGTCVDLFEIQLCIHPAHCFSHLNLIQNHLPQVGALVQYLTIVY